MAAGSIGLRVGDPGAALLLAIYHACNPDALGAALYASQYGAEAFRLQALRRDPGSGRDGAKQAYTRERKEQARVLRELAGRPFADCAAGDRFDGLPLETYLRQGYLPDPHWQLDGLALFAPMTHRPWTFVRPTSHGLRRVATVPSDVS